MVPSIYQLECEQCGSVVTLKYEDPIPRCLGCGNSKWKHTFKTNDGQEHEITCASSDACFVDITSGCNFSRQGETIYLHTIGNTKTYTLHIP